MKRKRLQLLLALLMTAATGAWAQEPANTTFKVDLKEGTADAGSWKAKVGEGDPQSLPVEGLSKGDAVTLTYSGRLKVKGVTATRDAWRGDLSDLTAQSTEKFATATDGMTIKGTLAANVKVSIAAGATVTLAGVTIEGEDDAAYSWAGITCLGDATIILADNSTNTVKGFSNEYPGIYVPSGKKLTIQGGSDGNGKLTASSNGYGAGIGGGYEIPCGDIEIQGGDITANGGYASAGIGGGSGSACGTITISGGTVTATGGNSGAGIGSGNGSGANCGAITISGGTVEATGGLYGAGIGSAFVSACGTITIASTVTKVTAAKGTYAPYSIGKGYHNEGQSSSCGTVTIGGTKYWENNTAVDEAADTYLKQATLEFVNLAKLTGNYQAKDNTTLFGQLDGATQPYKITIAAGATVTLAGVTILGTNKKEYNTGLYPWAGITCEGDATIILADATENTVKGFYESYPGIYVPEGKKLTIKGGTQGTGSLTASSNGYGAGIGGGYQIPCGDIEIQGGTVTATGGVKAAGIGSGYGSGYGNIATCGAITISGGTVTATGGENAAGIGSGEDGSCGNITIASTVKKVTAKKGSGAPHSIGLGSGGSCGTMSIGGIMTDGISQSPYTYEP